MEPLTHKVYTVHGLPLLAPAACINAQALNGRAITYLYLQWFCLSSHTSVA